MINSFIALGRITKTPRLRLTKSNESFIRFTLAINDINSTNFIPCIAFGRTAEVVIQNIQKGAQIIIQGKLATKELEKERENGKTSMIVVVVKNVTFINDGKDKGEH